MDGHRNTTRDDFARLGYAFPLAAMPAQDTEDFRARIEALEKGAVGYGPEAQKLYRFKPYLLFAWAAELVRHPGVLDAVEDVLGPDIMVWAAGLFIKEPHDPSEIRWHQDGFHMDLSDSDGAARAWIALTETRVANGTMSFVPGSHKSGFIPHMEDDAVKHLALRGEHISAPDGLDSAVPVVLSPGEMSLHHLKTVHGSPGNTCGDRRMTLAVSYIRPLVRPKSGRDTATLVRGEDRFGNWTAEPAIPVAEYDQSCVEAHRTSMAIRFAAYHGSVVPDS